MQTELSIERIRPRGIQKDISPRAVDIAGNRVVVNPVTDALNRRYLSAENAEVGADQNIPGTIGYDPGLPSGTNLVIGSFTDLEKNRIIFFNYNSNGNHGVYTWDPVTHAFTTLIQKSLLNFSNNPRYRITGAGIFQDLLYWSDGVNPQRMINMTRDYSSITDDACINLYKRPPVQGPTMNFTFGDPDYVYYLNSSYKTNALAGNIYQFATRYIYADNEASAFSLYSQAVGNFATDSISKFSFNGIQLKIYRQTEVSPVIKKIQLLYRKNNSPDWYLYLEKTVSDFGGGTSLVVQFYDDNSNTIIPQNESNKTFDSVPLKSKGFTGFKNRVFAVADAEGYTVDQSQAFAMNTVTGGFNGMKEGGNYSYGLCYYDKDMRTPGINAFQKLSLDYITGTSNGVDLTQRKRFYPSWLDSNYPSWAKYVSVCRSVEQNYEKYMQIPVKPMFYVSEGDLKDATGTTISVPGNMELYNNGKVYLKTLPLTTASDKFNHIHWQVPENIPFLPDRDCMVRIISPLTGFDSKTIINVLTFDGQSIVTNDIASPFNWNTSGFNPANFLIIEVFKLKKDQSKILYEISNFFSPLPIVSSFSSVYDSDSFSFVAIGFNKYKFKNLKIDGKTTDVCYDIAALSKTIDQESPSGVLNNTPIPESEQRVVFENNAIELAARNTNSDLLSNVLTDAAEKVNRTIGRNYSSPDSTPSKTPDYRRIPDIPGRPIPYNPNAKQLLRTTTIRYSETYIQDSFINGLSSFDFQNEYPISTARTPITKLQPAGDVLLAIHQRATTSMYIGQSVIQDLGGKLQIATTDKVIPNDNELSGKYGSYHAESIAEYRTMVFGFDIFQGVIWKYDNNGQVPVSDQGMKSYFKMKAEQYMPYKDTVAILGGIDPYNKEYLITFPAISGVAAETWAFNWMANGGAGEWTTRYSFIPDAYGYVNNQLISFANGKLWVHNQDTSNCNVFYGTKYDRVITVSMNDYPTKNKNCMAMQISAEELCEGDRYTVKEAHTNIGAFPGTGVIGTLYTANDTGKIYRWDGAAYQEIRETVIVTCSNREVQSTYMKRKEFDKNENIFYGPILKDTNTPSALIKAGRIALRDGRDMISQVLDITITNNSRSLARHHFTNVSYVFSAYGF